MKAYIRTYGCQMNERDSENIAADFVALGWEITDSLNAADVAVVNTCSVREQAEDKAVGKLGHIIKLKQSRGGVFPIVCVTGCMAQNRGDGLVRTLPELDLVLGARKTHLVARECVELFEKRRAGHLAPAVERGRRRTAATSGAKVDISDDLQSHLLIKGHYQKASASTACAFVSVMQGCSMNCSYCIVPKVRGVQRSRPLEDVVDEVRVLAARGVKEVTLLGQVVNAFGAEKPKKNGITEFVRLLEGVNAVDGIERIRFMSPHPSFFGRDLVEAYSRLEKLCPYVHLPMQSGSDRILKLMRRPYNAEKFMSIVGALRAQSRNMSISTDVIVGYPTETDADFDLTRKLFAEAAFDMAFVFRYSPRNGTLSAAECDDVPAEVKEYRDKTLLADLEKQSLSFGRAMVGKTWPVLVEGAARRGENLMMGRTPNHRKVIFAGTSADVGKTLDILVRNATVTALEGEKA